MQEGQVNDTNYAHIALIDVISFNSKSAIQCLK